MLLTEHLIERSALTPFAVRDIAFIPPLGIVSCFVSKNASSFLKTYLSCLAQNRPFSPPKKNPHMPGNTGFQGVEQLGHKKMSLILEDPSVPKIILGRHPVSRLRSAFISRVATWKEESYDSANRSEWVLLRQQIYGFVSGRHAAGPIEAQSREITWDDLVNYVSATPSAELDRHLIPQAYFAGVDAIDYQLVGTVEKLESFLAAVSQLVGKPPLDFTGQRINSSSNLSDGLTDVTEHHQRLISRRYRSDFVYFGFGEPSQ
jgi:hypothetical protein